MIDSVRVIGARGRVGSAVSARLAERGVPLDADEPELVLLCVPDRAIAEVAATIAPGPWVAHVSGATPLAALDPHARRFGLHPLQTFTHRRGPEQLDGAWAAVTGENAESRHVGHLARRDARPATLQRSTTGAAPSTTPARRSRPTTSSRSGAPPARCSRLQARHRRRSIRSCDA